MEQQQEEEQRRWKRGDVGPDGRIFWAYDKLKELWIKDIEYFNARKKGTLKNLINQKQQIRILRPENGVWKRGILG